LPVSVNYDARRTDSRGELRRIVGTIMTHRAHPHSADLSRSGSSLRAVPCPGSQPLFARFTRIVHERTQALKGQALTHVTARPRGRRTPRVLGGFCLCGSRRVAGAAGTRG
jgi:hypothetical protein